MDALADEDAPLSTLHRNVNKEDNDLSDELQDFRFLAAMTSGSNKKHQIPKRGEKDFEPHGTRHQEAVLAASRQAMHDALDVMRVHPPRSHCRAWYFGEGVEDGEEALGEAVRGRGLSGDHVVMVESSRGPHFRTMGKTTLGLAEARVWLLPEEALYLIERGNLDLWWPARPVRPVRGQVRQYGAEEAEEDEEEDDGLPLSLQAAYALLIGEDGERGRVSLDWYAVYTNLKRTGYVVFRTLDRDLSHRTSHQLFSPDGNSSRQTSSLFTWLFGTLFSKRSQERTPYGPLVKPGLYRSYNHIYRQLSLIPRHTPSPYSTGSSSSPQHPFRLVFNVWKPSRIPIFAKSNPGTPDFRIAVVSSRATTTPSLKQLTSLLESTPWDPPQKDWTGPEKCYQRLKHGWRNVIVAVVDQGIISYLRISEAAFGEEKLYERFDRGGKGGGKRGGGGSRGRGRGRGRGSGSGSGTGRTTARPQPQATLDDSNVSASIILGKKAANDLPPPKFLPINGNKHDSVPETTIGKEHTGTENVGNPHVSNEQVSIDLIDEGPDFDKFLDGEYFSNDLVDSDSEYGEPIVPSQKRKRATNNSFAAKLDDDFESSDLFIPPPSKRRQSTHIDREKGVLVGVWKRSPEHIVARKHAVFAFIDNADRIRGRVYPETQDGTVLFEGYPEGNGMLALKSVILDSHLASLSHQELKEYVRIRSASQTEGESLEERRNADALAIAEAKKAVASMPIPAIDNSLNLPNTPSKQTMSSTPNTPNEISNLPNGMPNGVPLGFWKDSDAVQDVDKHACYGIMINDRRLRVKVVKMTRDGRPYGGNIPFPSWVPYESMVLDPSIANLTRPEVMEYVRICQNNRSEGRLGLNGYAIDIDAADRARSKVATEMATLSAARREAIAERQRKANEGRKAKNEAFAAARASEGRSISRESKYESPYAKVGVASLHASVPRANSIEATRARDAEAAKVKDAEAAKVNDAEAAKVKDAEAAKVKDAEAARSRDAEAAKARGVQASRVRNSEVAKAREAQPLGKASSPKNPEGKASAVRSSKAESDARAEKLRRAREATAKDNEVARQREEAEKTAAKQREVSRETELATEREAARDREAARERRAAKEREAAKERQAAKEKEAAKKMEAAAKEGEATRRREEAAAKEREATRRREEAAAKEREAIRWREEAAAKEREAVKVREEAEERAVALARSRNAQAESARATSFKDDLNKREPLRGEANAYEERQQVPKPEEPAIAMNKFPPSSDVKRHNGINYERQESGPFAGKLVGERPVVLTIDGEYYMEHRVLMRIHF